MTTSGGRSLTLVQTSFHIYRIQSGPRGAAARSAVRSFLTETLFRIAGQPVAWEETPRGPQVPAQVHNRTIGVSISYVGEEAWLAVGLGTTIGVDATDTGQFPDWEEVASAYLEPETLAQVRHSASPGLEFARAWTSLEARLKMHRLPLAENFQPPPASLCEACFGPVAVTVALPPQQGAPAPRAEGCNGSFTAPPRASSPAHRPFC